MEITYYLKQQEGKTLEFKENCLPLSKIIQTVVAFANTAGGTLIIGVRDKTKEVIGLSDPLKEEERLANTFADGIRPLMIPDIQFSSFRDRNLIIVSVPHAIGPYYLRSEGPEKGVYVRLGSTNRRAGPEMIEAIRRLSRNISFDKQPCTEINSEDIDFRAASEFFASVSRKLTPAISKTLGLITTKEAARIWEKSDRTARKRLRNLVDQGHLAEVGTGPKDPKKVYVLKGIQDYKV